MYLVSTFSNADISGNIYYGDLKYTIRGKFTTSGSKNVRFTAAAPADLRLSYSGSGLPFANPEQAFDGTPNQGEFQSNPDGSFEFQIWSPNSYYTCQGVNLIDPHVTITAEGPGLSLRKYNLKLGPAIPNRSLSNLFGRPNRSYGR